MLQKRLYTLEKELEMNRKNMRKLQGEMAGLNNVISNQEKDIVALKKETQERDDTIQNKVSYGFNEYVAS